MKFQFVIEELSRNEGVFRNLLEGVSEEAYLWKPSEEKWCLLEVACHLYDEEREDFGARTRQVLQDPTVALTPIDPEGWVQERSYAQQDYDVVVRGFLEERQHSVAWLRSLESPLWSNAYDHPKMGKMSAELFLTNWLAHDYLHIRQIVGLKLGYLARQTQESLGYAGTW